MYRFVLGFIRNAFGQACNEASVFNDKRLGKTVNTHSNSWFLKK